MHLFVKRLDAMDDKQSKQRITVTIANRSYTLTVSRDKLSTQEPIARGAAEEVGRRYRKYQQQMSQSKKDTQDFLSLAAWDIAYDYLFLEASKDAEILNGELLRIDKELESYLQTPEPENGIED